MIRSITEYKHREWMDKFHHYKFAGVPITDMSPYDLQAALAFMIQYAGDTQNRLNNALHNLEPIA